MIGSALLSSAHARADEPAAQTAAAEKVATPTSSPAAEKVGTPTIPAAAPAAPAAASSPNAQPAAEPAPEPAPVLLHKIPEEAQGAQTPDDPEAQKHLDKSAEELEAVRRAEQKAGLVPQAPGLGPRDTLGLGLGPGDPLMRDVESALGVSIDGAPSADPLPSPGSPVALPELAGISAVELRAKYDIPVELNEAVVAYIRFFQTDAREHFAHWLARSTRWTPLMRPILAENKVPDDLVYLSMIESGFNPYAYSFAKAAGLWQFVVGTSRRYGLTTDFWVDERRDPILSTEAAGRYLSDLKDRYHGNWYLAWAGYNAGEGKVDKAIRLESTVDFWRMMSKGRTLRAETKHYVPKLIAAALISKHPERFGFHVDYEPLFTFDTVHLEKATSLTAIAKAANTDVDMIRELNPALRRFCTPPTGWDVRIPAGSKAAFIAAFEQLKAEDRLSFTQHKIERGDSLARIAKAYGVSEQSILRTNGLTKPRQLVVGRTVMIPLQGTHGLLAGEQLEDRVRGRAPSRTARDLTLGRATTGRPSAVYAEIEEARAKALAEGKTDPADDADVLAQRAEDERIRQAERRRGKNARSASKGHVAKAGTYKVKAGDTLSSIANKMGTSVEMLQRANGLSGKKAHALHIGQTLAIR